MPGDYPFIIRDSKAEDFEEVFSLLKQLLPGRKINSAALKDTFLKSFEIGDHTIRVWNRIHRIIGC